MSYQIYTIRIRIINNEATISPHVKVPSEISKLRHSSTDDPGEPTSQFGDVYTQNPYSLCDANSNIPQR